jgi:hypothetical protein
MLTVMPGLAFSKLVIVFFHAVSPGVSVLNSQNVTVALPPGEAAGADDPDEAELGAPAAELLTVVGLVAAADVEVRAAVVFDAVDRELLEQAVAPIAKAIAALTARVVVLMRTFIGCPGSCRNEQGGFGVAEQ